MMRQPQLSTLFAFTLLCCLVSSAWASTYQLSHTFQPDDPENAPFFGSAVVLEDGVAAIKSNSGYVDGDGLSKTHIFEQGIDGSWNEAAVLSYDSGDDFGNPYIGEELAIDNGEIVISYALPYLDPSSSHLQFATKDASGWSVNFNEPTPDDSSLDPIRNFLPGRSVDISGNLAIVNDPGQRLARIYEKLSDGKWYESANLGLILDLDRSFAPFHVAIDGKTAMIGQHRDVRSDSDIFFFEKDVAGQWSLTAEFDHSFSFFPFVKIEGDTAVALDLANDTFHIFQRSLGTWLETAEIYAGPYNNVNGFDFAAGIIAYSVSATTDIAAHVNLIHETPVGAWETFETIYDPNPEAGYQFGDNLALDQGRLLVGAPNWVSRDQPGLTYLFTQVPEPSAALLAMLASFIGGLQRRTR